MLFHSAGTDLQLAGNLFGAAALDYKFKNLLVLGRDLDVLQIDHVQGRSLLGCNRIKTLSKAFAKVSPPRTKELSPNGCYLLRNNGAVPPRPAGVKAGTRGSIMAV
ncbi:MAG TPA: hypothetical protein VEV41_19145 [Terriglobales bacterium]|nr:hypothetical protein [Terriglobales bacterium]